MVEVSGVEMKKGDKMILDWHTINLDEDVFAEPPWVTALMRPIMGMANRWMFRRFKRYTEKYAVAANKAHAGSASP